MQSRQNGRYRCGLCQDQTAIVVENEEAIAPRATERKTVLDRAQDGHARMQPAVEVKVPADKLGKISAGDSRRYRPVKKCDRHFATFTLPDVKRAVGDYGWFQVYFSVLRNNPFDLCACASRHIYLQGP